MIPKNLLLVSKNKLDDYVLDMWKKRTGKDWNILWYNDEKILKFYDENPIKEFPNIKELHFKVKYPTWKADIFRYYFLYLNGGIFCDSDLMTTKHLNYFIQNNNDHFYTLDDNYLKTLKTNVFFNGFMGTKPKNSITYKLLEDLYQHLLYKDPKLEKVIKIHHSFYPCIIGFKNVISKFNIDNNNFYWDEHVKFENFSKIKYMKILNANNEIIAKHFWRDKKIPKHYDSI